MKKVILLTYVSLISLLSYSQANFVWEKTDTISRTKQQIYSATKMFIAETWKSSKDVIQNDDKEEGVILVKGASIRNISYMMTEYVYIYNYNVTFKMKDGKYKMILDNVHCSSADMPAHSTSIPVIEPFDGDNCPPTGTSGISKKKAIVMMAAFKQELQSIVDNYVKYINKPKSNDSEW